MKFLPLRQEQWSEVKEIYLEAFPKRERKPFFTLKHSVKTGKAQIFTAADHQTLAGFVVVIPYENMVMVDYLAVSNKIRSKGTGSYIMKEVCKHFSGKKVVLLIERLDDLAENKEQRIARRRFYFKNGFESSGIFITGAGGNMEVLNYGGMVSVDDYLKLQKHALGGLFFRLSGIRPEGNR